MSFVSSALSQHGYQVLQATDGADALETIRRLRPSLILLDVVMPGLDGAELCRTLRADPDLADIPVVFVSALGPKRLHHIAAEAGANDYLVKPVDLAELLNTVGRYLRADEKKPDPRG